MMEGTIRETGTPTLRLKVIGRGGSEVTVEGILDTGFDGFLVIPVRAVMVLGLPFLYRLDANLADDRRRSAPVHGAAIVWDGREKDIQVLATGKRPLLGTTTALLSRSEMANH